MSGPQGNTQPPHYFFVYAPDKTDEGAFQRRLSARPEHLLAAKQNIADGIIRVGGFLTTPDTMYSEDKKMVGSTFVCLLNSIEEVRKFVEDDIYYKTGVWDPERIVILPFFPGTPIP